MARKIVQRADRWWRFLALCWIVIVILGFFDLIGYVRADQYGFTSPPNNYSDEYRSCAWPDNPSRPRYRPGYAEDRWLARCGDFDEVPSTFERHEE
jgi:hypothetical protein